MAPALGADGPELVASGSLETEALGSDDGSAELVTVDADVVGETLDGEGFTLDTGPAVEDEVGGVLLVDELGDVLKPPLVGATEAGPTELEDVVVDVTLDVGAGVPSLAGPSSLHAATDRAKPSEHTE